MESDGEFIMAVKYLSGNRLWGTDAERLALTSSADVSASLCYNMTLDTTNELLGSGCWSFNGSSSYVDLTQAVIRNGFWASGSNFTIAYWWRTNTYDYITNSMQCLTSTETEADYLGSYSTYAFSLGINLGVTYHDDNWHHVAIRYDGSDIIASIDGSGTDATGGANITPPTWNTTTTAMSLGGKFDSPNCTTGVVGGIRTAYVLDGELDDMGIWTRALTNTEVDKLYNNNGTGGSLPQLCSTVSSGLRVYYNFEQAVADGLTNQAGTNVDLNLPNGTVFITSDTNVHYMWNGTDTWNEVA